MTLPPEAILRGALGLLHWCAFTTRNWTAADGFSRQQIHDLWEAVHEIPALLTRWRPDAEEELLGCLDLYDTKWPEPHLRYRYEAYRNTEPSG